MEDEIKKYKKYIYISNKINPFIEEVCEKKQISLLTRFINEYNLENFLQSELKNLNNIEFLIIDYNSIKNNTKENDIVTALSSQYFSFFSFCQRSSFRIFALLHAGI